MATKKKRAQSRKLSLVARRMRAELEEWHPKHEFDLVTLMEERPKLFRALLTEPTLFNGSKIGEKYSRLVNSTVTKAEKSTYYKEAFISPRKGVRPKDKLSIGSLVPRKREKL